MTAVPVGSCGIVLAAGAGSRFRMPKGLAVRDDGMPWVGLAVEALREGGCVDVLVMVGAEADAVARLVPSSARVVRVDEWRTGMSASLRAGLAAASGDVAVVIPVDTPDVAAAAVARVRAHAVDASALVQATYGGVPGHPVALGRSHWTELSAAVSGDAGARAYLVTHGALEVECGDLWSGRDVDELP